MTDKIVIVGASLSGLSAAEAMRAQGYTGRLTIIGDEPYLPYDRPPLSKAVAMGRVSASQTTLPRRFTRGDDVEWRLGIAASGLDLDKRQVQLADGQTVPFDRVLLATGTRARGWSNPGQAKLDGVITLRGRDDAEQFSLRLAARPRRVLVIGGGFTGSEIASSCREIDIPVTVVARGAVPLVGALGSVIAQRAADLQRAHGVDLRCGVSVNALEGDSEGRFRAASLSDGSHVEADVAVVALGAIRNTEWLKGSGLAAGPIGVVRLSWVDNIHCRWEWCCLLNHALIGIEPFSAVEGDGGKHSAIASVCRDEPSGFERTLRDHDLICGRRHTDQLDVDPKLA